LRNAVGVEVKEMDINNDKIKSNKKKKFNFKNFKYGTLATVITIIFIAVVILINVIVKFAAERFVLRLDFTDEQVFTLGEDTTSFLDTLDKKAEIIILGDEKEYRSQVSATDPTTNKKIISAQRFIVETTDNYKRQNKNIDIYYIDPRYNPSFFKERGINLNDGTDETTVVVIYSPDTKRYRFIKSTIFQDLQYVGLERRITAGLLFATRENIQTIAVVTGHGEEEVPYFQILMEDNGYDVKYITLQDFEAVPDKVQMLVINNPKREYSVEDIDKIDAFLQNDEKLGKHIMVFGDLDMYRNEHLESYLSNEWGMEYGKENIFDSNTKNIITLTSVMYPLIRVNYSEDKLSADLSKGKYYPYVQLGKARPVKKLFDTKDNLSLYSLIESFDSSFGKITAATNISATDINNIKKADGDAVGPFNIAVLARRVRYEGTTEFASSVIMCGSTSFVNDYFLSNVDGMNQATPEYMVKLTKYLVAASESIDNEILPKSLIPDSLNFTDNSQVTFIFLGLALGVPAIFGLAGFLVWRRRRYL
jgi:hypothetical protein